MKLAHLPSMESLPFPAGEGDVVHVDTYTEFDFLDRIKILFFGTVATSVRVVTEHKAGGTHAVVATYVSTASREKGMLS